MSQDSSNNPGSKVVDFFKTLVRDNVLRIVIGSVVTGIGSIIFAAIRSFFQCNTGLSTIMLILLGLILVCGSLVYVRVGKKEEEEGVSIDEMRWGKPRVKSVLRYTELQRRVALVGIIAVLLLTLAGFAAWKGLDSRRVDKTMILVANFHGPDSGMTEFILHQLKVERDKYADDLIIKPLKETITEQDGSETAREKGNCHKASIVLWGWYNGIETANGFVYFEVLKGPQYLRTKPERPIRNADIKTFKIQTELSSEISYLALLTIGLARYEAQDYQGAIERFNDALRQQIPKDMISPAVVHFFKGLCHYEIAQSDRDRVALETAIREFDESVQDLNAATRDADDEKMKWSADFNSINAKMLLAQYPNEQDPLGTFEWAARTYETSFKNYVNAGVSEWAVKNNWGFALYQLGKLSEGAEARDRLKEAVEEFNDAIGICTREKQKYECALTYYNLGNTSYLLGQQPEAPDGDEWLGMAEKAFRNARYREDTMSPDTVNGLANVQVVRGEKTQGEPGNKVLRDAVESYESLQEVYEDGSRDYATAKYNLGYALLALSTRLANEEAKKKLLEANKVFTVAIEVSCSKEDLKLCAKAERDLGRALHMSGEMAEGEERTSYLKKANENFTKAMQFFTATKYPEENRKISNEQTEVYRALN